MKKTTIETVFTVKIVDNKLWIHSLYEHESANGEHYLPDTTADNIRAFLAPHIESLAADLAELRPWRTH